MSAKEFISKINAKNEKYSSDVEEIDYENDNHESTVKVQLNEDQNVKNWSDFTKNLPITITTTTKSSKTNDGQKVLGKPLASESKRNTTTVDFKAFQKEKFDLRNPSGKDLFDHGHNPSHSTLYPDVLKIKQ